MRNNKFKLFMSLFSILCIVVVTFGFALMAGINPKDVLFFNMHDDSMNSDASSMNKSKPKPKPIPKVDESTVITVQVTEYGKTQTHTKSIDKNIMLRNEGSNTIDLSKVKVRYYFTKECDCAQKISCDGAVISYNSRPWYDNYERFITSEITKVKNNYCYADIGINKKGAKLEPWEKINIFIRIRNVEKIMYNQENDYSYNNDKKVVVYYDDKIASGEEQQEKDME